MDPRIQICASRFASPHASCNDVADYLRSHNVDENSVRLFLAHDVDGLAFCLLTEVDLRDMEVNKTGERKYLIALISAWKEHIRIMTRTASCSIQSLISTHYSFNSMDQLLAEETEHKIANHCILDINEFSEIREPNSATFESHPSAYKLFISLIFLLCSTGITSYLLILVHERLPNMDRYPPLPDLVLDRFPRVNWSFKAAEGTALTLAFLWAVVIFFHKHRCLLLQRYFFLMGILYLLRSLTMIVTSLSVSDKGATNNTCPPFVFLNRLDRFKLAFKIWFGGGLSINGIHTCGDYIFSGHTTYLIILTLFITEYTPKRFRMLHIMAWLLSCCGILFIMLSGEHYTVDVLLAIFIPSQLFLYYHLLTNTNVLHRLEGSRIRFLFPGIRFFESDVHGIVPNVYEVPIHSLMNCIGRISSILSSRWRDMKLVVSAERGVVYMKTNAVV